MTPSSACERKPSFGIDFQSDRLLDDEQKDEERGEIRETNPDSQVRQYSLQLGP